MGHFIVPGTTRLQRYSIHSVAPSGLECEFPGYHISQACYISAIMSQNLTVV